MIRSFRLLLLAAGVVLAAGPAAAQKLPPFAPPTIAVIDTPTLLRKSDAARNIQQQIEAQRTKYQEQIARDEKALRQAEQELVQQRALLSPEAFAERRRQFEQRVADFQKGVQAKRRQLDQAFAQAINKVESALLQVIADIAKEAKVQLVLRKSQIVIAEKALDISDEALARLNKKISKVAVELPPIK